VLSKCTIIKTVDRSAYESVEKVGGRDESKDNTRNKAYKDCKSNW
jgi:hypothetical protein